MKGEEKRKVRLLYAGDRMVNFRPVLFLCMAFGLGIFLFSVLGLYALLFCAAAGIAAAVLLVLKRLKARRIRGMLLFSLLVAAVFAAGALSLFGHFASFTAAPEIEGDCTVVGTVEEIGAAGSGQVFTLRAVRIADEEGREYVPRRKLALYVCEGEAEIGMTVYAEAAVTTYDIFSFGRMNTSAVIGGVRYRADARQVYVAGSGAPGVFDAVRGRVRSVLFEHLGEDTAPVAYAMLLGDSGYMDEDVLQNFRYGGVAHIFAVSGLHIGIVYGLLAWLLKKLRVNRWVRLPVVAAVLVFYAGICGFSPSSVRALVMCLTLSFADAAGLAYDRLNSVSLAAFVMLLVNPVHLFSVGFQLSVAAAAGIIVLGGRLSRLLARVRFLPKRIGSALAVCFSAQVCTFPLLLDSFGYASVLGLVLNLVFIPIIGLVYSLLFVCTALAAVFPFAGAVLLFVPSFALQAVVTPILLFSFDVLLICGFSFGGLAALFYGAVYLCTDKINLRPLPRAVAVLLLCAVLTVCMLFRNGAFGYDGRLSLHSYYGENNILLLRRGGQTCLIATGVPSEDYIERLFLREGVRGLDGVIVLAEDGAVNTAMPVLLRHAEFDTLYVSAESSLEDPFRTVETVRQAGVFSFGGGSACFFGENILWLDVCGTSVVVASENAEAAGLLPRADVLIADSYSAPLVQACAPQTELYFAKTEHKTTVYSAGDLQIVWKGGILSVSEAG